MSNVLFQNRLESLWQDIQSSLETEAAEEFLQLLLNSMSFVFVVNHEYRKNIRKFKGSYQFLSKDGELALSAVFDNSRMKVVEKRLENPDITITFRDGKTLFNFFFAPKQDILGSMLRQDVQTDGNLDYLYRLGFLAKRLQLMLTPG